MTRIVTEVSLAMLRTLVNTGDLNLSPYIRHCLLVVTSLVDSATYNFVTL